MTDTTMLFRAFLAGVDVSTEGFNGEYLHPRWWGDEDAKAQFLDRMREDFDKWLKIEEEAAGGQHPGS